METEKIKEKARIFLKNDLKVFIKDSYDNYYFCLIDYIDEDWILVKNFGGNREGEKTRILYIDIERFEEYKERGE